MIPVPEKYIADFERLAYGMFIHWGLYSLLECGEKTLLFNAIPNSEYKALMRRFTAEEFKPRELAKFAKSCGMNYITLTARHHDGFSLFDTCGLNDFDAPHSACSRDLIGEFVEGCNAEGVVPMLYHTTLDWWQDSFKNDFDAYLEYLYKSVELLCKNYGKIGGLWFDGNWSKPDADWKESELYGMIRKLQPEAMIINNTGTSKRGEEGDPEIDSVTFENGRPGKINREGKPKYLAAEMCQPMNTRWGYGAEDFNYQSPADIIETLAVCRRYGSNYLLNVGPYGSGEIPMIQRAILDNTARWIKTTCPEVIYKGRPTDVTGSNEQDFALGMDGKLYLFIHKLSTGGDAHIVINGTSCGIRSFEGIEGKIKSVRWTDNNEELSFADKDGKWEIYLTDYPYGHNMVVRVAEITLES